MTARREAYGVYHFAVEINGIQEAFFRSCSGLNSEAEVVPVQEGGLNTTEHKLRQHILSRTFGSGFSMDLMVKDLGIAASVARQAGMPTVFVERCLEAWQAAQQSLGHGRDHTEMARWIESVMAQPHTPS